MRTKLNESHIGKISYALCIWIYMNIVSICFSMPSLNILWYHV